MLSRQSLVRFAPRALKSHIRASITFTASSNGSILGPSYSSLLAIPKKHPNAFQIAIACVKTGAADLLVQTQVEGRTLSYDKGGNGTVDTKRSWLFCAFGGLFLGVFQGHLLVTLFARWFPTMKKMAALPFSKKITYTAGLLDVLKMSLFDIFVYSPFMYFPTFFTFKEFIYDLAASEQDNWDGFHPMQYGTAAFTNWKREIVEGTKATLVLWGPCNCIGFVLPLWLRMPWRHCVSFVWTLYMSYVHGSSTRALG
jgi:hypothetical protein